MRRFSGKKNPARRASVENDGLLRATVIEVRLLDVELAPVRRYRKTAETYALRMDEAFEVDTLEGLHRGNAGDYLAIGAQGELYPIDASIFEETYELLEE